jgi:hypothetical protein
MYSLPEYCPECKSNGVVRILKRIPENLYEISRYLWPEGHHGYITGIGEFICVDQGIKGKHETQTLANL